MFESVVLGCISRDALYMKNGAEYNLLSGIKKGS